MTFVIEQFFFMAFFHFQQTTNNKQKLTTRVFSVYVDFVAFIVRTADYLK